MNEFVSDFLSFLRRWGPGTLKGSALTIVLDLVSRGLITRVFGAWWAVPAYAIVTLLAAAVVFSIRRRRSPTLGSTIVRICLVTVLPAYLIVKLRYPELDIRKQLLLTGFTAAVVGALTGWRNWRHQIPMP